MGDLSDRIESEGGHWDTALGFILPIAGAAGSAWVSPEVAAADGWLAVFFSTLTWSLGIGLAVFFVLTAKQNMAQAAVTAALSLLGALVVAYLLGTGVLFPAMTGSPQQLIAGFVIAAFATYGIVGTLLGGGIGAWLGYRFAQHALK